MKCSIHYGLIMYLILCRYVVSTDFQSTVSHESPLSDHGDKLDTGVRGETVSPVITWGRRQDLLEQNKYFNFKPVGFEPSSYVHQ